MNILNEKALLNDIQHHLKKIYPHNHEEVLYKILPLIKKYTPLITTHQGAHWSEDDVMLITYGDSVVKAGQRPLQTLCEFMVKNFSDTFSSVHILPFFPYSSDDGFSVIDYRVIHPSLGKWEDIKRIADRFKLMADLVINHVSRESLWFADFVANQAPARDYFLDLPVDTDTSMVTRPRNTPLLVRVNTHRGIRHVWATFSEDQIDVNFSNPDVLLEFIDILLFYIANGARLIRLDAIAFLWKKAGTNCIHLDETHEVVKLLRDILNHAAPGCLLLTETNVPHKENLSYFGAGDEAHMIYQFSLPPLVLHAMNRGSASYLTNWASQLPSLPSDCTYLNFLASHDGIGLRALEGILPEHEKESLIDSMHKFGGFVSMKANPEGEDTPYEINISLFDAMQGTRRGIDQWQVDRFICSQAILLTMQGIPAIYIHSILATPNDIHGVELSGRTRSINRKKWEHKEINSLLESHNTPNHEVFHELKRIITIRRKESCFHPESLQEIIDVSPGLFTVLRTECQHGRRLLAIFNVTSVLQKITIRERPELSDLTDWHDLVNDMPIDDILPAIQLQPYQFVWLLSKDE